MTKILLVEDDKSLREIYGVRLLAEGYDIVSAGDGEEALAVAIREKPDLIISDVMMPKMSGFEMLDLLRGNDATKDIKVIMMTALSSEQQRDRGEKLGADRYLVKSQVGIEDVITAVHEVLGDKEAQPDAANVQPNQSPVNPPTATLPSAAANVPAPSLPPVPTPVPTITDPNAAGATSNPFMPSPQSAPLSDTRQVLESSPVQLDQSTSVPVQNIEPAATIDTTMQTTPTMPTSPTNIPNPQINLDDLIAENPNINSTFPQQ